MSAGSMKNPTITRAWDVSSMFRHICVGFSIVCEVCAAPAISMAEPTMCLAPVVVVDARNGQPNSRVNPLITEVVVFPESRWPILGAFQGDRRWLLDTSQGYKIHPALRFPANYFDGYMAEPTGRVIGWNGLSVFVQSVETGEFTELVDQTEKRGAFFENGAWFTALGATVLTASDGLHAVRGDRLDHLRATSQPELGALHGILDLPGLRAAAISTFDGHVAILDKDLNVYRVPDLDAGSRERIVMHEMPGQPSLLVQAGTKLWIVPINGQGQDLRPGPAIAATTLVDSPDKLPPSINWFPSVQSFLYWGNIRQFWIGQSRRTLWRLEGDTLKEIEGFSSRFKLVRLSDVASRKMVVIIADDAIYTYTVLQGLRTITDGLDPKVGRVMSVIDSTGVGMVIVSTSEGLFSLEVDGSLIKLPLPPGLPAEDINSFRVLDVPAWKVALFFTKEGIWSIDVDRVIRPVVRDLPHGGLPLMTVLPALNSVFVSTGRSGNAILLDQPADQDGRCLHH